MLLEPESCARMVGGQDVQLSEEHISLWQSFSSSQFPPPFCLWGTLPDRKGAEIITEPTPWLCHCVLMKGEMTSAMDCLLVFWQIALCGQQRGQVTRVGEAHWTAGGWSTGWGETGNASLEGQHDPSPSQGVELMANSKCTIYFLCSSVYYCRTISDHFIVCKSDKTPPPERLRPQFLLCKL